MDPIDGTANLVKQQEDYCIILAYFYEGKPAVLLNWQFHQWDP
jgi:myo-inositol-1(or 4)-monophosphatase